MVMQEFESKNESVKVEKEENFYVVYYDNKELKGTSLEWYKTSNLTSNIIQDDVGVLKKADPTVHPFDKCGYLSFKNGGNYCHGSGQFVKNSHFILTAAHCIFDNNVYSTTLRFSRAMSYGSHVETFTITKAIIPQQWIESHDYKFDYALLITELPSRVEPLSYDIYGAGVAVDVMVVGYPSVNPTLYSYDMYYVEDVMNSSELKPDFYYLDHTKDMGNGASGGAWLKYIDNSYSVIGLTSHGFTTTKGYTTFSPKLSSSFSDMFDFALKSHCVNPAGHVTFFSNGGYTVEFTLKYTVDKKCVKVETGRLLSGKEKNYDLPVGASDYEVSCCAWNGSKWKDAFYTEKSETPFNCTFRTYGALPNPKMEKIED